MDAGTGVVVDDFALSAASFDSETPRPRSEAAPSEAGLGASEHGFSPGSASAVEIEASAIEGVSLGSAARDAASDEAGVVASDRAGPEWASGKRVAVPACTRGRASVSPMRGVESSELRAASGAFKPALATASSHVFLPGDSVWIDGDSTEATVATVVTRETEQTSSGPAS